MNDTKQGIIGWICTRVGQFTPKGKGQFLNVCLLVCIPTILSTFLWASEPEISNSIVISYMWLIYISKLIKTIGCIVILATLQMFNSHMWPVATILVNADTEHFHCVKKL